MKEHPKLKILLYSPVFFPGIGGVETVSACLAENFVSLGHNCVVLTPEKNNDKDHFIFKVIRKPGFFIKLKYAFWADIVYSNGASLAMFIYAKIFFKPFVWTHVGYQAACIDGLGWVDGVKAPMTPWASVQFHYERKGLFFAIRESMKLFLRRAVAKYFVSMNVVITDWVGSRLKFKKQTRIYNPFPLDVISAIKDHGNIQYDFFYVGRLVSEKGIDTLLKAFDILVKRHQKNISLLIIGDGDRMGQYQQKVKELNLTNKITFAGKKFGNDLVACMQQGKIGIVPSEWEEPMGVVALEIMAAGRNVIVSKDGGLSECVGEVGLVFPNGDEQALANKMLLLLEDESLAMEKKKIARKQLLKFDTRVLTGEYLKLFYFVSKYKTNE